MKRIEAGHYSGVLVSGRAYTIRLINGDWVLSFEGAQGGITSNTRKSLVSYLQRLESEEDAA